MAKIETYDIETEKTTSLCLIDPVMLTAIVIFVLFIIYFMYLQDKKQN
jgi:heme/copper-type cytochrome/quinol oxidase subunit 4